MDAYLQKIKDSWNKTSDSWYTAFRTEERIAKLIDKPESSFHPTVYSLIRKYLPELNGKRILVPSSGDNHAVFSFALMGAKVTSSDLAERQLENAAEIADRHCWDIEFICDNTMKLDKIPSDTYDFVYTSNGVHVWINELELMYHNIYRVLKGNGICIMYDIHPFNRPFDGKEHQPKIIKPYTDITPYYHWRVQDFINAMIQSNLEIQQIEELSDVFGSFWFTQNDGDNIPKEELEKLCDWKNNPMAALPQWLSICAQKRR